MNQSLEKTQNKDSPLKQITDEEINECMQFCSMYNILHAIHNFKIELKNVDEKKLVKIKTKIINDNLKVSSLTTKNKQSSKKVSKFEKPKTSKKKQQKPVIKQQPQSDVDNYDYQQQPMIMSRLYEQPLESSRKKIRHGFNDQNVKGQSEDKQKNLSSLISNLAVSNHHNTQQRKSKQNQDSSFSAFYMNSTHQKPQNPIFDQSKYNGYHNQQTSNYQNNNLFINNPLFSTNNANSQYLSNYQPFCYNNPKNNYNKSNPYSQAAYQGINYDLNHFIEEQMTKSPSQYTNFTSTPYTSQFDAKSNYSHTNKNMENSYITRNLFHQQSSPLFNTSYQNPINYYHQKNSIQPQQTKFTKITHNNQQIQHHPSNNQVLNKGNDMSQYSNYMPSTTQQNYHQQSKRFQQYTVKHHNQETPTKINTSRINNRSISPLGTSTSCRNFFIHSPRNISHDDKSQTSRSKSRRKQRPGGSKSFYQPSLSGRKIVSKQKQQQIPPQYINNTHNYQYQDQFFSVNKNEQQEVPYFRQQRQEQVVQYKQKKYPNRMTRQTEISAVSGWQQGNHSQKSTKSQQVIVSEQYQKKKLRKDYQVHQNSQNLNENRENKKSKQVRQSSSEHSSQQSSEVQLDNIQAEMEQLSNSRKKIPVPIKIDMTKKGAGYKKDKK